jgi:prepilin-type processing-associated H-X9-DG protein
LDKTTCIASPEDLPFDLQSKLPKIGGLFGDGVNAVFCDGSVRFLRKNIDDASLRALITRNGGEPVDPGDFLRR